MDLLVVKLPDVLSKEEFFQRKLFAIFSFAILSFAILWSAILSLITPWGRLYERWIAL